MSKWAVMLGGEDVWFVDDMPERFDSEAAAIKAIDQEIELCEDAVKMGYMEDCDFEDYRIVEVVK